MLATELIEILKTWGCTHAVHRGDMLRANRLELDVYLNDTAHRTKNDGLVLNHEYELYYGLHVPFDDSKPRLPLLSPRELPIFDCI